MEKTIDPKKTPLHIAMEISCSDGSKRCIHYKNKENGNSDTWPLLCDENGKPSYELTMRTMKECDERRADIRKKYEKGEPFKIKSCKYFTI